MDTPVKQAKPTRRIAFFLVASAIAVLIGWLAWNLYWQVPGRLDYALKRKMLDQIVGTVRTKVAKTEGRTTPLMIDGTRVFFRKDADGNYSVTIVTADWRHVGMAGYLYSENPPKRITGDSYRNVDAPGDAWMLERQVAPKWWVVSNHLY